MVRNMIKNVCKLALIYVLLILNGFTGLQIAEASILSDYKMDGRGDRIRKYNNINYTYSSAKGFQCYPDGLRSTFSWADGISPSAAAVSVLGGVLVNDIILAPFICGAILALYLKTGLAIGATMAVIVSILDGFLDSVISRFDFDIDFGLDIENTKCLPVIIPLLGVCAGSMITFGVTKLSSQTHTKGVLIALAAMGLSYAIIKNSYGQVQYSRAQAVFNRLKICGDNWATYGNYEFQNLIDKNQAEAYLKEGRIIPEAIEEFYPSKGFFDGSYKYYLDKCIKMRDFTSCMKIDPSVVTKDNDYQFKESDRLFREYKYQGKEYAYPGCNDPRPIARTYDVNLSSGNSNMQLYYSQGSDGINFACERFLEKAEWMDAYKCCVDASNKLLCIEYTEGSKTGHIFCSKDEKCIIKSNILTQFRLPEAPNLSTSKSGAVEECLPKAKNSYEQQVNSKITELEEEIKKLESKKEAETSKSKKKELETKIEELKNDKALWEEKKVSGMTDDEAKNVCKELYGVSDTSSEQNQLDKIYKELGKSLNQIELKIYRSEKEGNKYCVATQSFCPYDFNLMGGTEKVGLEFRDTAGIYKGKLKVTQSNCYRPDPKDSSKKIPLSCLGRASNFCQIDRHCVYMKPYGAADQNLPSSPYIDKSCINMIGTSHNNENYKTLNTYMRVQKTKDHLTAPLVECIIETSKNFLFNVAGFSVCQGLGMPDENDACATGYVFKRGENLDKYGTNGLLEAGYKTTPVFNNFRHRFKQIAQILLVLAIVFYGFNMVMFGAVFRQGELMKFLVKIVVVSSFAMGGWWIKPVLKGVFTISNSVINLALEVTQIDSLKPSYDNSSFDGCYFGDHKDFGMHNNYYDYGDRGYLAFFDFVDCKINKYLGFEVGGLNMVIMAIGYFFAGSAVIILAIPLLMIFLSLILVAVKIVYIFVVSMLTLILLLFFAPFMFPLMLFKKTEKMFQTWIMKIVGYIFYPIFLIVAMTILFLLYDTYYTGEAVYFGRDNGPHRELFCGYACKAGSGMYLFTDSDSKKDQQEIECKAKLNGDFINLKDKSILCSFVDTKIDWQGGHPILNLLGNISYPVVVYAGLLWKTLFGNYCILLLIILFIDKILDGIIRIGSVIFGVGADSKEIMSVSEAFSKIGGALMKKVHQDYQRVLGAAHGIINKAHKKKKGKSNNGDVSVTARSPISLSIKEPNTGSENATQGDDDQAE